MLQGDIAEHANADTEGVVLYNQRTNIEISLFISCYLRIINLKRKITHERQMIGKHHLGNE